VRSVSRKRTKWSRYAVASEGPFRATNAAAAAGAVYFLIVFLIGFALGAIRVFLVAPRLGELTAVLLELPLMLAASWMVCRFLIRRMAVTADVAARLLMGLTGFALLMLAEMVLGFIGFGRSLDMQLAALAQPAGLIGLAGQMAFGAIPLLQLRSDR
jgi:hypothetical protein